MLITLCLLDLRVKCIPSGTPANESFRLVTLAQADLAQSESSCSSVVWRLAASECHNRNFDFVLAAYLMVIITK